MKNILVFSVSFLMTCLASANANCPSGSGSTINDAYRAMQQGTYWVDMKKVQSSGKLVPVGIVFINKASDPGFNQSKPYVSHGGGTFKIDYNTNADADWQCRRQIVLDGKVGNDFTGWIYIDNCAPGSVADKAEKYANISASDRKKIDGKVGAVPSFENPIISKIRIKRLRFSRKNDKSYGPHCEVNIQMVKHPNPKNAFKGTTFGGAATYYKWRLRDSDPFFHGQLVRFNGNGNTIRYTPK